MKKVIFACIHNAGRSQMAKAWFNAFADPSQARATSAGTNPATQVHPEVVAVMKEVDIDLSTGQPQKLTEEVIEGTHLLITMGCGETCPVIPGVRYEDWQLTDPKGQDEAAVRAIRDDIRRRVEALLDGQGWRKP